MGTPIQNFAERFGNTLLKHSKCPICGDQMYYWKHQEVMGQPPTPTCPTCGHGELVKKEQLMISERLLIANKQDAINRMKRNSIITDTKAWQYNFDNYNVYDHETSQAKHIRRCCPMLTCKIARMERLTGFMEMQLCPNWQLIIQIFTLSIFNLQKNKV